MEYAANPRGWQLKKTMYEFLQHRYPENEDIIERIGHQLVTEKDSKAFMRLMMDVYETGYTTAVEQHKEQLAKIGVKVSIVRPEEAETNDSQ
jgi:hypothetical protein